MVTNALKEWEKAGREGGGKVQGGPTRRRCERSAGEVSESDTQVFSAQLGGRGGAMLGLRK